MQWKREIANLLDNENIKDRPLQYFSFPGEDMLDIRVLANLCESKDIKLKCFGMDEDITSNDYTQRSEMHISRSEISERITEDSALIPDSFSQLAIENSFAYSKFKNFGHFDVVNLDFCNSFFGGEYKMNHQALKNIFEHQINSSPNPWLLFITTRSDRNSVEEVEIRKYWEGITENMKSGTPFFENFIQIFSTKSLATKESGISSSIVDNLGTSEFSKLFGIGLGKWIIRIMSYPPRPNYVRTLDSCWYRVYDTNPDMLSLAVKFIPILDTKYDPSNITDSIEDEEEYPDEYEDARCLLTKVNELKDLDVLVEGNQELFDKCVSQTVDLLTQARYGSLVRAYPDWAKDERISNR